MSDATLVFSDRLLGFEVSQKSRMSAAQVVEGVPPPPSKDSLDRLKKKVKPPSHPDPAEVRKQVLAEAEPRIRKETEERVWKEAEAKYRQDLDKEISLLKVAQQDQLAGELARRTAIVNQLQLQFDQFVRDLRAEIADQVVQRSVEIAELLLRHELPDRSMLVSLLKATLEPITDLQGARVKINPEDLKLLKSEEELEIPYDGQFEWTPDTALQPGELIIESRNGIFDASIEQRIVLLKEQLRQRVGKLHGTISTTKT